jgi:hypothetical protein
MTSSEATRLTAFLRGARVAQGKAADIARCAARHPNELLTIIDDRTGGTVDLDLRRSPEPALGDQDSSAKIARGRPRLGVTAREVTLLPRHWEWLAAQPGGASATLRRLVDQARRETEGTDRTRLAQEATYRAMTTLAGDLPGYEEAVRALFAQDRERFGVLTGAWPKDIGDYIGSLSEGAYPAPL